MQLLKGREIADKILINLKKEIKKTKFKPTLGVLLVGENKASKLYVGLKQKAAESIGMGFDFYKYNETAGEAEILSKIDKLNRSDKISGIIVQLPLPNELDRDKIISAISLKKDVDGFHCENQKNFCCGNECRIFPVFPKAIIRMIQSAMEKYSLKNIKKALIVCVSDDFGIVMQEAFRRISIEAEYLHFDKIDVNLEKLKEADVLVTACGVVNLINSKMTKSGVIIIDGGITKVQDKIKGDVDLESFQEIDSFISPVPGGVGPVTVACLLENTYLASEK